MARGLDQQEIAQFEEQGFVVGKGLLSVEQDIEPLVREYEGVLDELCRRLYADGKLRSTYAELPFGRRLIQLYADSGEPHYQHLDISLPQANVTDETPMHLGPAVFALLTSPRLLDAVEALIGPEIVSNPVQHVRIKPPQRFVPEGQGALVRATSWHQDQGVVLPEADESNILTVWLPITAATVENGCLTVLPGSHREGLATHCPGTGSRADLHIPDQLLRMNEALPLPLEPGDVLFMHRRTKHASLSNQSDDIRWSFDLRYNPIGHATGRPAFPSFVARSRANPDSVISGFPEWADLWHSTRARLAGHDSGAFNRWEEGAPVCA